MGTIALRTQTSHGISLDKVRLVLSNALRREVDIAGARRSYFERSRHAFEQQYQISSP